MRIVLAVIVPPKFYIFWGLEAIRNPLAVKLYLLILSGLVAKLETWGKC